VKGWGVLARLAGFAHPAPRMRGALARPLPTGSATTNFFSQFFFPLTSGRRVNPRMLTGVEGCAISLQWGVRWESVAGRERRRLRCPDGLMLQG
jgi:hypothetical protein